MTAPRITVEEGLRRQLWLFRQAMLAVSAKRRSPSDGPPLAGCCGASAMLVRGCFGGLVVAGRINGSRHYWNRLPSGEEVDLTSCQFGGDGFTPLKRGRAVTAPDKLDPIFALFGLDVLAELHPGRGAALAAAVFGEGE